MVTLGGATPFITNNITPKGGGVMPISRLISMRIPNLTGSKPSILEAISKKSFRPISVLNLHLKSSTYKSMPAG